MKTFLKLLSFSFLFAVVILAGCKKDDDTSLTSDYAADVAVSYFDLALKLTKETPGFSPPVAARAYGYTSLTLYEAVVNGMKDYQTLQSQLNEFDGGSVPAIENGKEYQWEIVASSALADIMGKLYKNASAENLQALSDLETEHYNHLSATVSDDVAERSRAYGELVGEAIYQYSVTDGQDEAYLNNFPASYTPPVGVGLWVPTPPAFSKALQPYWGEVRPFLAANVTGTQPAGHPEFSTDPTSAFYAEAFEVYTATINLTDEQTKIAQFWSDDPGKTGTPPGHSIAITSQVLDLEDASLETAAEAYAKVGLAVHDAFVSCWKCKFQFNLMRPVTYILEHFDPAYTTLLTTPPFPEYTSGHSVQSGATAQILTDLFGENYAFTDHTHETRTDIDGSPRAYDSFFDMAEEAAISRLYGGIHYRAAIEEGVEQGKLIGQQIGGLEFRK